MSLKLTLRLAHIALMLHALNIIYLVSIFHLLVPIISPTGRFVLVPCGLQSDNGRRLAEERPRIDSVTIGGNELLDVQCKILS